MTLDWSMNQPASGMRSSALNRPTGDQQAAAVLRAERETWLLLRRLTELDSEVLSTLYC